ncbi:glycosyltransferase [Pseudoxanthomonas broegbernensis]|uniref:Glycosyltransferase n=1 Tax=Pseudoxanthomonas broegbernensis TaxID=83619 RepID=A0A7V8GK85_9GAMM|nr:glycosyltransferase family 2 protein [Pseudoxanthomonas broegbernensis]KAF1684817.1 glycosyltransferase [Pseudoxanthomonas broegbernensis]MBB6066334.1 dolichol-phosphate mannosyltransferase [Pseudoxanthomonas broegbernensis]
MAILEESVRTTDVPGSHLRLSVVTPCFNEEDVIGETYLRLTGVCREICGEDYEIVFVDDGSNDSTWTKLEDIAHADPRIVALKLSRNFGHQAALTAGLQLARADRVMMIDADLQDPPELLGGMLAKMDEGFDVVYGKRIEREGETRFKKASASVFYRVLSKLTEVDIPQDTGDFRIVNRKVLDALLSLPEHHRFVRGMVAWLGFQQYAFPYVRQKRFAGTTKYPLRKMVRLAIDAITGFSVRPLRISIWFAMAALTASLALIVYTFVSWLLFDTVKGWASLLIAISIFSAANFLCLGIFGEYLGRLFTESKRRPLFLIDEIKVGKTSAACGIATKNK